MNVLTIVQIGLFVPFFLLFAIFAIVYLINGYKKDFGRSLISLLATVVAIGISLLLAKLLGGALSGVVVPLLPAKLTEMLAETGSLGIGFLQGAIEIALSFLLFGVFFIISLAILKTVGKKIHWSKLGHLNTGKTGTRIAGMGLRAIDAVLVSVMLLLPLYGTIATVAPPAAALMRISESTAVSDPAGKPTLSPSGTNGANTPEIQNAGMVTSPTMVQTGGLPVLPAQPNNGSVNPDKVEAFNIREILDAVANHPVLVPYKHGPGAWVYSELSSFSMNGKTVELSTAANSLDGMLEHLETFRAAIDARDEQGTIAATQNLIDYARKEVIHQRWSYNMVMAFVGEIDAVMEDIAAEIPDDDKLMQMYDRLRPLLDMSFEDYTINAEGLLDFAAWLIEIYGKYGEGAFTDADATGVKKELLLRIGNLLNLSEQAVAAKQFVLQMFAQNMFDVLPNAKDPNYADYYAARKDLPNSAAAFVSRYFGSGFVPESDRAAEAGALFAMFDFSDALDVAEAFARHPLFGADAVLETMDEYLYINGINLLGKQLASSDKAAEAYRALDEMLRNCENVSWDQELSFSDQAQEYLIKDIGLSDSFSGTFTSMIRMGEDGKIYIIPEDLIDELAGLDKLDANTIQKYGLKPFEGFTMPDGSGEGSFGGSITILPDGSISGSVGGLPEGSIGGSNGDSFIVVGPNFQFGAN